MNRNGQSLLCSVALFASLCLATATFRAQLYAQTDYAAELPRIPPTAPEASLANFDIADGFRLELVASEPLIGSPVAAEWTADGKLFVCEMRGYSEDREQRLSTIALLEDTDGDGRMDRRHSFAEGLYWPTAIFPFDGGLFVGDAPDLLYLKDTDGDSIADRREVILTGFGTSNVQGLFNSFRWGLDNRIHIACSSVGGNIQKMPTGKQVTEMGKGTPIRGRDIALDPWTRNFEITSATAQHGMCFDDWGNKFSSSNSDHIQQVMYEDRYFARNPYVQPPPAKLSIAADGPQAEVYRQSPVEPWRIVRTRLRVNGLAKGPIEGGGRAAGYFTGATGVTIFRGDGWPEAWKGYALVGDVGSNLVHRKQLVRDGLHFSAQRVDTQSEFVTSEDIWFRPAQFLHAPDGMLHIIDVCREVIEHPKSLPPEIKQHLDLTSGRDRGRIYRIRPEKGMLRKPTNLHEATNQQLVNLLGHANAWHRETAARLLCEREAREISPLLVDLVKASTNPLARLHALYLLEHFSGLSDDVLLAGLKDSHEQIRRHAIRLAENCSLGDDSLATLAKLVEDDAPIVRYQLAFSLGAIRPKNQTELLVRLLMRDPDNQWIRGAVQSSLLDSSVAALRLTLAQVPIPTSGHRDFLTGLIRQIKLQNREQELVATVQILESAPTDQCLLALPLIGELLTIKSGSRLAALREGGQLDSLMEKRSVLESEVRSLVRSADTSEGLRFSAVSALRYAASVESKQELLALIVPQYSQAIQRQALRSLGPQLDQESAENLVAVWRTMSPAIRSIATDLLLSKPEPAKVLLENIIQGKIPAATLDSGRLRVVQKSRDAGVLKLVETLMAKLANTISKRDEVVKRYLAASPASGNAARGKKVFETHCASCHRFQDIGYEIGPSLASMKERGASFVITNVFDPNREVNPQYLNYVALLEGGRTLTGMIQSENSSSITLRRGQNEQDELLRVEIEQLQSTGQSLMPEGLEQSISLESMADLLRYLLGD